MTTIEQLASDVLDYCALHGLSGAPDPRGGTFPGGILLRLDGGTRIAFLMPHDPAAARASLNAHLDEVYPGSQIIGDVVRGSSVQAVYIAVPAEMPLAG